MSLPPGTGPLPDFRVVRIYRILARHIDPRPELVFADPFQLLVAVVLSAQATDVAVNQATATLFPVASTPAALLTLGPEGLLTHIRRIGLANTKARNLLATCRILLEQHHGQVPRTRPELMALPGVGPKSAAVILNTAFAQPLIAVDTHVHRVANRLGIVATTNPLHTEAILTARTPPAYRRTAHHLLILHGRYTCTARQPRCSTCPVVTVCWTVCTPRTSRTRISAGQSSWPSR